MLAEVRRQRRAIKELAELASRPHDRDCFRGGRKVEPLCDCGAEEHNTRVQTIMEGET